MALRHGTCVVARCEYDDCANEAETETSWDRNIKSLEETFRDRNPRSIVSHLQQLMQFWPCVDTIASRYVLKCSSLPEGIQNGLRCILPLYFPGALASSWAFSVTTGSCATAVDAVTRVACCRCSHDDVPLALPVLPDLSLIESRSSRIEDTLITIEMEEIASARSSGTAELWPSAGVTS